MDLRIEVVKEEGGNRCATTGCVLGEEEIVMRHDPEERRPMTFTRGALIIVTHADSRRNSYVAETQPYPGTTEDGVHYLQARVRRLT